MNGVARGQADCWVMNNYRAGNLHALLDEYQLTAVPTNKNIGMAFALRPENIQLYAILERLNQGMSSAEVNDSLTRNTDAGHKISLRDFVKANLGLAFLLIVLVLSVFQTFYIRISMIRNGRGIISIRSSRRMIFCCR